MKKFFAVTVMAFFVFSCNSAFAESNNDDNNIALKSFKTRLDKKAVERKARWERSDMDFIYMQCVELVSASQKAKSETKHDIKK